MKQPKNDTIPYNTINWLAIFRELQRRNTALSGISFPVRLVEKGQENEVAYTTDVPKCVYLNPYHSLLKELDETNKVAFIKGCNAHELLHQIYSNFDARNKIMMSLPTCQRPIFAIISNSLEDPAIENSADQVMGGTLLSCLLFSIAYIYKMSPPLSEAKSAFAQYISALIQFGDMGPLKGEFTFPEARKAFIETAPLFERGIAETDGAKRMDIALEIMHMTRFLWEDIAKHNEQLEELMKEFQKQCKSMMNGSGSGQNTETSEGENKKSSRRKITVKKVSKEELEEMKKNGEISENDGSGEIPDGDITLIVCEDEEESKKDTTGSSGLSIDTGSSSKNEEEKNNSSTSSSSDTEETEVEGEDKKSSKNSTPSDNKNSDEDKSETTSSSEKNDSDSSNNSDKDNEASENESKSNASQDNGKHNPFTTPMSNRNTKVENQPLPEGFEEANEENGIGSIAEDEYTLSSEDVSRIIDEILEANEKYTEEEHQEVKKETPIDNFNISSPKLGKKSCLNYRVSYSSADAPTLENRYIETKARLNPFIRRLTNQLKYIFQNDYEVTVPKTSGCLNVKRYSCSPPTPYVFDRRIAPSNKSHCCIELLVDESGSMCSNHKATSARECCIALSEVFANLKIPVYVIGFTADTQGYDIVHNHYITWNNTKKDRTKLLNITARANNCDGYSIRYATEVLKKNKTAEHKLLIVLSDGQPAARNYYDGVADTKQAIKEAKKYASVLGVAIGNNDTNTIHSMYEKDFLHVSKVEDLTVQLAQVLKRIVKKW